LYGIFYVFDKNMCKTKEFAMSDQANAVPAKEGYFGPYGGQFVPEALVGPLNAMAAAFEECRDNAAFNEEMNYYLGKYVGRPNPIFHCANLSLKLGGARIYLKREDLNHLGAHKLNNTIGQILLARHMGKRRIIAETGAGQHGVATAAAAALMGMKCVIYMGEEDTVRQALNVFRMRMMGADVVAVTAGQRTLKEAVDAAIEDWIANIDTTFYLLGSAVGPHPYPTVVRHFQSVIGREARAQMLADEKALPDYCVACVGGGSNAIGMFAAFLDDAPVKLIGVEPAGRGLDKPGEHAATITKGTPGVLHGFYSYLLQDDKGEAAPVHSISPGLDYPSVGPEHAMLKDTGRVRYESATDREALDAFLALSRSEGIIPALESAHALACAMRIAPALGKDKRILVCLSGRGDKDVQTVAELVGSGQITI
jgi:tryptophan synthase beta chain